MNTELVCEIERLDDFTRDEIYNLIEKAEDTRAIIVSKLNKYGGVHEVNCKRYDDFLSDLSHTKEIKRRRAIVDKMVRELKGEFKHDEN